MRMPLRDVLHFGLAMVLTLLAVAVAAVWRKWWRSWRSRRRARVAHDGERRARELLARAGFTIEGAQVRRRWMVSRDGVPVPIEVRADYVVTRGRDRFVADVKTGKRATRITTPATRRQLLEYRVAYDVTGVLLVDMDAENIHEIGFEFGAVAVKVRS